MSPEGRVVYAYREDPGRAIPVVEVERALVALAPEMVNPEDPLRGVVKEQRNRNSEIGDVLNIGSGTRCKHCGMLHFMWRENCGSCGKPMEYNLGHRDEGARE